MNFDSKRFATILPSLFAPVFSELNSQGFVITLVGGVVRDFILTGKIGKDWDIELGHATLVFNIDQWKQLGKRLGTLGKTTFLPYEIIRLEIGGFELEFSPPRKEIFLESLEGQGHKNFSAEFDYKLPFEKSVQRRDFTLNAMGVRFISLENINFLDPMGGLQHLKQKTLHPCGADFARDPVRFLRAMRFSVKLDFHFSPQLVDILTAMDKLDYSAAYLWSEMQKSSDPVEFLGVLVAQTKVHPDLKLPMDPDSLQALKKLPAFLHCPGDQKCWIIALAWVDLPVTKWQEYFSLSKESCLKLTRWVNSSKEFTKIMPESFQEDFELMKDKKEFLQLFDWYFTTKNLLQKNPDLPLLKIISEHLPHWVHLYNFEAPKDVKHIDPPLRAKYQVWNLCQRL